MNTQQQIDLLEDRARQALQAGNRSASFDLAFIVAVVDNLKAVEDKDEKMFKELLKEWLKGPYGEEYGQRSLSILDNLKNFAAWLDTRIPAPASDDGDRCPICQLPGGGLGEHNCPGF